ncbi:MAG: class A beta-lactamase [Alphaproteobacteria bacterium]|nr:class A beta-lactamase [Alphaproteobacteria bacterium]MBU1513232.1 class A beta-lactamase [Alphaproteobacteria bacterium]MBU2095340.1 class A beta-lactamase [Alphaproteobacteria bacterium]MBU2152255.1 class A beta-lactamase [Alphaproteobacteria bacterium]MBU2306698.1 class A beta-lactamase [Alphaproteobacteria bacterium]
MPRLEEPARRKATLDRRAVLIAAPAGLLAACEPKMPITVSTTPKIDIAGLTKAVVGIAAAARPANLGVGLSNLESGEAFVFNGDRRFPMQSVFKLPLAAAVLAEVDAGRALFTERVTLEEKQLSPAFSPIAEGWPARKAYSLQELFEAMVVDSDNTAADVLMKRIGGPGAVTAWLTARHVPEVRVDRYERELQPDVYGMPSFRPAWLKGDGFQQARDAVPPLARLAAMRAYMADPRDTATPRGMLEFLQMLERQELVSPASTALLTQLMVRTSRGNTRIKAGLPKGVLLAHRPGTSGVDQGISTAHNDVGVFTFADRRSYALAVFLSGSTLDDAGRDRIIAEVARAAVIAAG